MAHLSTAQNIISSCQISSHLIKIIATFIVIINSVIFTGAIAILHLISASLASRGGGFLDQIKCRPSRARKITHSHHHIHCFNATDILFTYSDILTPADTKIARFSHVGSSIIDAQREGPAEPQSMAILSAVCVSRGMKNLDEKNEKRRV